jgi:hypothetical protein
MTPIITSCIIWIACGVLAYGATLAYFQREYPSTALEFEHNDRAFAVLLGTLGPIGLFVAVVSNKRFKHGFMWRRR